MDIPENTGIQIYISYIIIIGQRVKFDKQTVLKEFPKLLIKGASNCQHWSSLHAGMSCSSVGHRPYTGIVVAFDH